MTKGSRLSRRMHFESLGFITALLAVSLVLAAPFVAAQKKDKPAAPGKGVGRLPLQDLSEDQAILHALNRLGFGPRPGDVDAVRRMGLEKWIDRQLHPESIADSNVAARLARFQTLNMSSAQLLEEFPRPEEAARRAGMTLEEYRKEREEMVRQRQEGQRGRLGRAMDGGAMNFEEIRTPQRIIAELSMAKLIRAIYSERQLNEVMADFWFNHFNVFAAKGADRWLLTAYERDVIRPHALGKFRDLLEGTAKSPAMLFYLDNWMSADPKAAEKLERELAQRRQRFQRRFGNDPQMMQRAQQAQQFRRRGLNENYARELMELHTLGVDGGYTQQDVIEVARCFTGWTLQAPRRDPEYIFDSRLHDNGPKTVLGKRIDAGGMKDGEAVLDLLARHPNTAKFISTKLARRFVSDNPPSALVDRMAKTFLETDGDIRAVLKTMFDSPEFWSRDAYRAKIKKPFELVASAARAVGAEVDVALPLVMWTARIGEPLYMCQPPTGYSDKAEAWVNTGALLNRLNFTLTLSGNRMRSTRVDLTSLVGTDADGDPKQALDRAIATFLAGQVSPGTRATLEKQLSDPQVLQATLDDPFRRADVGVIAGLVLGTPEFQRR